MKLKELKKEILTKGGEVIDKESFEYDGKIHYFKFMINKSPWWLWWVSRNKTYLKIVFDFKKYGVINKKDYSSVDMLLESSFRLWLISFIFMILISIFSIIFWPFFGKHYKNNVREYTNNFKERIDKLEKWAEVWKKSTDYSPKLSKKAKWNWAFERIMIVAYALRKDLKIIPTIEKYKLLNEKLQIK